MFDHNVYPDKLKDPRWQRKRLEIFQRDDWTCLSCMRKDKTLHVHHILYIAGLEPWEYDNHLLVTYCEVCHNTEHLIGDTLRSDLIHILQSKPMLIQPLAAACILADKYPAFRKDLQNFMKQSMINYLKKSENGGK